MKIIFTKFFASLVFIFLSAGIHGQSLAVFPNPFNQTTTVEFSLAAQDTTTLDIVSVLGQTVKVLLNDTLLAASHHSVLLNASSLPDGSYTVRLRYGNTMRTLRVVKALGITGSVDLPSFSQNLPYPIPCHDRLFIPIQINDGLVGIIDVSGKVTTVKISSNVLDVSGLATGTYILKIVDSVGGALVRFQKE